MLQAGGKGCIYTVDPPAWTNTGRVLPGAGSAASAQTSKVFFFTGSLQGDLCFPKQHNAMQTGQESSLSHAAVRGRKAVPCSAEGR